MRLDRWIRFKTRHLQVLSFLGLVTTFAALAFLIEQPKGSSLEGVAVLFLVSGGILLTQVSRPQGPNPDKVIPTIATRLLDRLTWRGRFVPWFPLLGVALILADFSYNLTLSATPAIQTEDIIVLLAAATLLGHNFVPARFDRERDFVLLFFLVLNGILVMPLLVARAYFSDFERSVDIYSWIALAPETGAFLSVLGVSNSVHAVAGYTAPGLTFTPQHLPIQVTLVITTACSGIYSFGIFASAFVAFVLAEERSMTKRIWVFLGLGLFMAYVANVLRMVAIVLVGYYTDTTETDLQNLLIAHSYAGWLIFLGWISVFWGALFKFLPIVEVGHNQRGLAHRLKSGPHCVLCLGDLTPAVPAIRCLCGQFFHKECLVSAGLCPLCGRPAPLDDTPYPRPTNST